MLYAALACLFMGGALGALWLLQHVGSGWPKSQHDPKPREVLAVGVASVAFLCAALILTIIAMARP